MKRIIITHLLSFLCLILMIFGCTTIRRSIDTPIINPLQYGLDNAKDTPTINPLQYGLDSAKTGSERYEVLLRCHKDAVKKKVGVCYKGIKRIDLEVPATAISIPLSEYTDFANVIISVGNNKKNLVLFEKQQQLLDVDVSGTQIDNGDYRTNLVLKNGMYLLVVEDAVPWVKKRVGYDYGAIRKDVFFIKDGVSNGRPVSSYCTSVSRAKGKYCAVDGEKTIVKNLRFERKRESKAMTFCIKINGQYLVELANISITTPDDNEKFGDAAIQIMNCSDVTLNDIKIDGTYSQQKKYGYGINLNNVYDLKVNRLYARAKWGVFGNYNINKACLTYCDINRFDIHCYGRDISFDKCNFVNLYNQFSSVFGKLEYSNCTFTNFYPVLLEASFNAYTPFDLYFKECTFNFDKEHNSILVFSGFVNEDNSRLELKTRCLPNIYLTDCHVNVTTDVKKWYVFNTDLLKDTSKIFHHVSNIVAKKLSIRDKSLKMDVFSSKVNTSNKVKVEL